MTQEERNKRRALIVRRWAAYRIGCAQREIWRRKREATAETSDLDEIGDDDLLAEIPEGLIS